MTSSSPKSPNKNTGISTSGTPASRCLCSAAEEFSSRRNFRPQPQMPGDRVHPLLGAEIAERAEVRRRRLFGGSTVIRLELLLCLSLTCAMRRCGPRLLVSADACGARPPLSARISRAASSLTRENSKRNRRGRGVRGEVFAPKYPPNGATQSAVDGRLRLSICVRATSRYSCRRSAITVLVFRP